MKTALLDQFCGPLCDTLLGTRDSQQMLERLEKANLFLIPLDDRRCWFRYHHLFADLLRVRLRQTYPEQVPVLYRGAAEWFAQSSLWQDAIRYALQTQDMDFGADLFETAILKGGLHFLYSGMQPLIEPFPSPVVQKRPLLSLAKAVAIFDSSQLEGIEPLLRSVEAGILSASPFPEQADVLGWIYIVQIDAALQLGNPTWAVEAGQQVPKWIPKDFESNVEALVKLGLSAYYEGDLNETELYWQQGLDLSLVSSTYHIIALLNCMARLTYLKGELKRSEGLFRRAFDLLEAYPGQYLIWLGAMQRDYSDLLRDGNRLEEARAMIVSAIPLLEKWHSISALGYGFFSWARILMAAGDLPAAHEMLNKVEDLHRRYTVYPDLQTLVQVTRARLFLEAGDTRQAWQILETCLNAACGQHAFLLEWVLIVQARILVRTGYPADALTLLAGWLEQAKANGRGGNWLSICLITALVYHALGDRKKAFQLLRDGLIFAQAEGHRLALVEEGEALRDLLEAFRVQFPQSPFAEYVTEILTLFPAPFPSKTGLSGKVDALYETLSPREVEILRLVCQGLSNQEIARQLVLSVGTVKFHIHHIFGKLGVRDRPQAIAKAVQLRM